MKISLVKGIEITPSSTTSWYPCSVQNSNGNKESPSGSVNPSTNSENLIKIDSPGVMSGKEYCGPVKVGPMLLAVFQCI